MAFLAGHQIGQRMLKIVNGFLESIRVVENNCLQHSSPWVLERSEVLLFQANEMPFMIALDRIFWWARFHSLAGVIFALPFREVQEPCAFAILPGKKVRGVRDEHGHDYSCGWQLCR